MAGRMESRGVYGAVEHVPATVVQCLSDRLDNAPRRFVFTKEQGGRCGFPRRKGGNRWHSVHRRQFAKREDDWIDAARTRKIGKAVEIKLHRALERTLDTCHLVPAGPMATGTHGSLVRRTLARPARIPPSTSMWG